MNDQAKGYECSNKKCKWTGTDEQKAKRKLDAITSELVCPECGNNSFYGLLELPTKINKQEPWII